MWQVLGETNYRPDLHVWEDLEFNLRLSGRERLTKEEAERRGLREGRSVPLGKEDALAPRRKELGPGGRPIVDAAWSGGAWMSNEDPEGPAVLCKCYRFGMYKKPMGGGCGDYVARPEVRAAAIYFVVNLS